MTKRETVYTLLFIFAAGFLWQLEGVYISALVALLSGMCLPKKEPWQPEIGDVYFYVAVGDKGEGLIHAETLFDKNDIKFLL